MASPLTVALPPGPEAGDLPQFRPAAHYYAAMDFVLYLEEDVPYRADRVDVFLTLLWHPTEDRAVGVKLKGFRYLFDRFTGILRSQGIEPPSPDAFRLVAAIEVAMTAGAGAELTDALERRRKYERARSLARTVRFNTDELPKAA